jgi:uncharacterized protein RhaS with RHS repeats
LLGGTNHYQYASNPVVWIDPFGLTSLTPKNAQQAWRKEQAPKEITSIHGPEEDVPQSQWHAHCSCGAAVNQDGSIHDKNKAKGRSAKQLFSRKAREWLEKFGWKF